MEPTTQPNKYLEYIRNNKYNVYVIAAIAILLLIILMIIIIISTNKPKQSSSVSNQNPVQNNSGVPSALQNISPSAPPISIFIPDPTQAAVIQNQMQPQITPNVAVPYTVSNTTQYGNDWAVIKITNPNVGAGVIIMQKVNGEWKVVLGPGSFFSQDQLQSIGAPQELINSFNNPPSTVVSISPSPQTGD